MNITVLIVVSLWKKLSAELAWILLFLLLSVSEKNALLSWHEYYCSCCCQSLRETLCWVTMNITVLVVDCSCCCQSLKETLCWVGMNISVLVVVSLWEKLSAELPWILLFLLLSVSERNSLFSWHEYYCSCCCKSCCCQSLKETLCWVGMNITVPVVVSLWKKLSVELAWILVLVIVSLWGKLSAELAWILLFWLLSVSERNSLLSWHEYYCSCCCRSLRETLLSWHEYCCSCCCRSLREMLCWVGMDITVFVVVGLWEKCSAELAWILLSLLLSVSERNSLLSCHGYYCSCYCQSLRETLCWVGMNITVLAVIGLWEKLSGELTWILLFLLLSVSKRNSLLSWHEYYCSCYCRSLRETLCWVDMNITVLVVVGLWEKCSAELAWILLSLLLLVSKRNSLLSCHGYNSSCCCQSLRETLCWVGMNITVLVVIGVWEKLSAELDWILLFLLLSVSVRNSLLS